MKIDEFPLEMRPYVIPKPSGKYIYQCIEWPGIWNRKAALHMPGMQECANDKGSAMGTPKIHSRGAVAEEYSTTEACSRYPLFGESIVTMSSSVRSSRWMPLFTLERGILLWWLPTRDLPVGRHAILLQERRPKPQRFV